MDHRTRKPPRRERPTLHSGIPIAQQRKPDGKRARRLCPLRSGIVCRDSRLVASHHQVPTPCSAPSEVARATRPMLRSQLARPGSMPSPAGCSNPFATRQRAPRAPRGDRCESFVECEWRRLRHPTGPRQRWPSRLAGSRARHPAAGWHRTRRTRPDRAPPSPARHRALTQVSPGAGPGMGSGRRWPV